MDMGGGDYGLGARCFQWSAPLRHTLPLMSFASGIQTATKERSLTMGYSKECRLLGL